MSRTQSTNGAGTNPTLRVGGPWLTVAQVAVYLALTKQAVRDLEWRGVLPGHRFGASLRFSRTELDELLAKGRKPTVTELANGTVEVPTGPLGPLMNQEQAVKYVGLPSLKALEHRLRRGQLPAYRLGGQWRFRAVELDQTLQTSTPALTTDFQRRNLEKDARLPGREVK